MKKIGIAIDDWKLSIFERHLKQAGYSFEQGGGVASNTLMLYVYTENPEALEIVVRAANTEARRTGTGNA